MDISEKGTNDFVLFQSKVCRDILYTIYYKVMYNIIQEKKFEGETDEK